MKKKYGILNLFLGIVICFSTAGFAADEDLLFQAEITSANTLSSQSTASASLNSEPTTLYNEKKSVNFSGQLNFETDYAIHQTKNQQITYTDTDIFLDIRHPKQIKTFLDLNLLYLNSASSNANMAVSVKELFLDFNVSEKAYFRVGKQFINWSTTYFWNPTDFINTDRRNFFSLNAIRGGTSGIRVHIPDTWERNFYFFINMDQTTNLDQASLTAKYVWVQNSSELGISLYNKYQHNSKLGLDLSTRWDVFDIKTELALSPKEQASKVIEKNNIVSLQSPSDTLATDWTMNIGRTFNWERANRIMLNYEFFYHSAGYREYIFADPTKKDMLLNNNLYEMNYYAWAYHAIFMSINEFPTHSSQSTLQLIQNLLDYSGIASAGITYTVIDELNLLGNIYYFLGSENTEYLQNENKFIFTASAKISF